MKVLKIVVLFVLASLPLLLARKGRRDDQEPVGEVDSDSIFDQDLSTD